LAPSPARRKKFLLRQTLPPWMQLRLTPLRRMQLRQTLPLTPLLPTAATKLPSVNAEEQETRRSSRTGAF
jgi:hypothetical protein